MDQEFDDRWKQNMRCVDLLILSARKGNRRPLRRAKKVLDRMYADIIIEQLWIAAKHSKALYRYLEPQRPRRSYKMDSWLETRYFRNRNLFQQVLDRV